MTLAELFQSLKTIGYPVAYSHFVGSPPSIPFITYIELDSDNFIADNKVYKQVKNINIELYTDIKDLEVESKIENLLDQMEIPYQSFETYIESENLFQKTYEIGVI